MNVAATMRAGNDLRSYHRNDKYSLLKFTSFAVALSEDRIWGASATSKSSPSHDGYSDEPAQKE